jgi:hypothetical protein
MGKHHRKSIFWKRCWASLKILRLFWGIKKIST